MMVQTPTVTLEDRRPTHEIAPVTNGSNYDARINDEGI
jgi:hypothetical protein